MGIIESFHALKLFSPHILGNCSTWNTAREAGAGCSTWNIQPHSPLKVSVVTGLQDEKRDHNQEQLSDERAAVFDRELGPNE